MLARYQQQLAALLGKLKDRLSPWTNQGMQLFSKLTANTPDNLIALEVGADQIKLLKIKCTTTPYLVEYFSISPTPEGAIVKGEIKNQSALSNAIKATLKNANLPGQQIALAIPRSLAIIKNINIDNRLTSSEIESRAWIEAGRHFPDLVGDIYMDFTISESPTDASHHELTLVACRKDQIKPYLDILQNAGVNTKLIDINCYALNRALPLTTADDISQQTVALLNLNVTLSTLIVSSKLQLIYSHDQSYDGHRLLSQVNTYQKDHPNQTEQQCMEDPAYINILKENLVSHLRHTIHFFYSTQSNRAIQRIILSGDCSIIPGLATFIKNETGIPTTLADPLSKLELAASIDKDEFRRYASTLIQCSGLATSRLETQ